MRSALWLFLIGLLVGCTPSEQAEKEAAEEGSGTPEQPTGQEEQSPPGKVLQLSAPLEVTLQELQSDPRKLARAHCFYTQGPIPNWLLVPEFEVWLTPEEQKVARELMSEAVAGFSAHLPQQRAVARFLTSATKCEVTAVREDGDTAAVGVKQQVPLLADPGRDIGLTSDMTDEEVEERWFEALSEAFEDKYRDDQFGIRLVRRDGLWYVDAQMETMFAEAARAHKAMKKVREAVDRRDWDTASNLLPEGCAHSSQQKACDQTRPQIKQGIENYQRTAELREQVSVANLKLKGIVNGGIVEPMLQAEVTNPTDQKATEVWVSVSRPGKKSTVCRLMGSPPPDDALPLQLGPGETSTGYCRLDVSHGGPAMPHRKAPAPGEVKLVEQSDSVQATVVDVVSPADPK